MKAVLHRILKEERWVSIDVYSDRLSAALNDGGPGGWECIEDQPRGMSLPGPAQLSLYVNRVVVCPIRARRFKADVHHILDNSYGHLVHSLDARRTVVTSHGGTPLTWRQWNREGPAMRFFDWAFSGMLKANRILIVSEYSKRELVQNFEFDPERVHVVYHGIDSRFQPLPASDVERVRSRYLRNGERYLLLHVGHCAERKNVDGLLLAFAGVLRIGDHGARLLQVGGQFTDRQQQIIRDHDLSDQITQVEHVQNDQLVELYNAADVFVFPSLYEGFGIPLIEAMASGTPVVCSDYELFHEVCEDAAVFTDTTDGTMLAEAITGLLADPALREQKREAGLIRSTIFRWEEAARRAREVYSLVLEEAGPVS